MITDRQLLQLSERVNKRVALKLKIWEGIPLFIEKIDQETDTPFNQDDSGAGSEPVTTLEPVLCILESGSFAGLEKRTSLVLGRGYCDQGSTITAYDRHFKKSELV